MNEIHEGLNKTESTMSRAGTNLVLFPTIAHAHPTSGTWSADVHGWCYDGAEELHYQKTAAALLRRALKLQKDDPDPPLFRERAAGFVVDNRKKVLVEINYGAQTILAVKSRGNGHFKTSVNVTLDQGNLEKTSFGGRKSILSATRQDSLTNATGPFYLIPDRGISVISDIDDTIKFSNVADRSELLANTFLRPYRTIDGMPQLFQNLAHPDSSFHYISATPWQMVGSVMEFLRTHGFPEGSVHLRKFALKDITFLKKIFPAHKKKRKAIEHLLIRFPQRKFLLFGDTGEKDPQIYGEVARRYPDQILGICLRKASPEIDRLRLDRHLADVSPRKWVIFEEARQLESKFLPEMLAGGQPSSREADFS